MRLSRASKQARRSNRRHGAVAGIGALSVVAGVLLAPAVQAAPVAPSTATTVQCWNPNSQFAATDPFVFGGVRLTAAQITAAQTISDIAAARHLTDRAARIGIAAAMQASGLNPLYRNGSAVGLFAQKPGAVSTASPALADRSDPAVAARTFFDQLTVQVPGYQSDARTDAEIAALVTGSGTKAAIAKYAGLATQLAGVVGAAPATSTDRIATLTRNLVAAATERSVSPVAMAVGSIEQTLALMLGSVFGGLIPAPATGNATAEAAALPVGPAPAAPSADQVTPAPSSPGYRLRGAPALAVADGSGDAATAGTSGTGSGGAAADGSTTGTDDTGAAADAVVITTVFHTVITTLTDWVTVTRVVDQSGKVVGSRTATSTSTAVSTATSTATSTTPSAGASPTATDASPTQTVEDTTTVTGPPSTTTVTTTTSVSPSPQTSPSTSKQTTVATSPPSSSATTPKTTPKTTTKTTTKKTTTTATQPTSGASSSQPGSPKPGTTSGPQQTTGTTPPAPSTSTAPTKSASTAPTKSAIPPAAKPVAAPPSDAPANPDPKEPNPSFPADPTVTPDPVDPHSTAVPAGTPAAASNCLPAGGSPSQFDPGSIISDEVFYDTTAMTAQQITAFVNRVGAACTGSWCLRSLTVDVPAMQQNRYCDAYAGGRQSAAQAIAGISAACGINPQVMLVTLQKEAGLLTRTDVTQSSWNAAWGWHCPDTGPGGSANCDPAHAGFVNQLYGMAQQWSRYKLDPDKYHYRAGQVADVMWNVKESGCGSSPVYIRNTATASLYNYTPYQPNAASLAAYPAAGDKCSSYGNRNFFVLFGKYFGGTGAGTSVASSVSGTVVTLPSGPNIDGGAAGQQIVAPNPAVARGIAAGLAAVGLPYVWGGGTNGGGPDQGCARAGGALNSCSGIVGFDCSGLTAFVLNQAGFSTGGDSASQRAGGQRIPWSQAQPGDIIGYPGHVSIFLGWINGVPYMLQAPSVGKQVQVRTVYTHNIDPVVHRYWS